MYHTIHNTIANCIWNIAEDVLRDVYVRGKYRDVILPMTVKRRLDALLEPTKAAVIAMKRQLDDAGVAIRNLFGAYPRFNEQLQIVDSTNKEFFILHQTITRTEKGISLIQEYRTRLISDVITCKFGVRSIEVPDFELVEVDAGMVDEEENEEIDNGEGNEE